MYVRGWEGAALGKLGFNVIFGAIAGYLIDKVASGVTGKDKAAAVSHHVEIFTDRQEFSFERRNTYYFKMKAFSKAER